MKVSPARENVFELMMKGQELSALVAGARMALDIMERDPHAPIEAIELLRGVIGDYDKALARPSPQEVLTSVPIPERSLRPTPRSRWSQKPPTGSRRSRAAQQA
jgi:hypothetical protein